MRDLDPTPDEEAFFTSLSARVPGVDDWYHCDEDGTPWMVASLDFITDNFIAAVLRVDYDGQHLRGGWSPACLNWDDGVRAADSVDTSPPDGLIVDNVAPLRAADIAAEWFIDIRERTQFVHVPGSGARKSTKSRIHALTHKWVEMLRRKH
ncbi:hypothetical protein [Nocardia altamirensis]|uniref:hypothetical protein n=1 Tax=Nocardia altamirensis TaxID=472158 RepID=UPI0008401AB4|nr:hypothetical protein [Nocardia altamirensis]